ncbi:MAG: hypothetical protein A2289_01485 [Deltaproteobacteria bacterium RIFOXYA12_FULL_58_15]|nr:MAG: hypothetical protein A2289_01485 [Deltaproteobacteria bacterium RIFOXYA12_FULL_58_15]OGR12667.1 MAG: hypothetical protein A2341_12470 [Deltaproteobacteria bacterium RIFOXYB12_FULL_58_9]
MPGRGGTAVAHRWRKRIANLPVIFVSGYPQGFHQENLNLSGPTEFLPKPFSPDDLLRQVAAMTTDPTE